MHVLYVHKAVLPFQTLTTFIFILFRFYNWLCIIVIIIMKTYSIELKNKILQLISTRPMNYGQCCESSIYSDLGKEIYNAVPLLQSSEYSYKTRIYWILNDIFDFPKCEVCGKQILRNVSTLDLGYHKSLNAIVTCSKTCMNKAKKEKTKNTNLKRYGVENPFAAKSIIDKIKQTNIERYGISNGGNTKTGREKAKQTLLSNYGKDGLKSIKIKQKKEKTCIQKYGVSHYSKSEQRKTKIKKNNCKKFVAKLLLDPEIEFVQQQELNNIDVIDQIYSYKFHCKCKKCGNIYLNKISLNNYYKYGTYSSCPKCHPFYSSSIYEKEIIEFLKNIYAGKIITNNRTIIKPLELDIVIPDKYLAIEFDGLYWHSTELDTDKNYHLTKTNKCNEKNIQLIHVFENEWILKKDIIKSRIKNLLGIYDSTIFARKCQIKNVSISESKAFQEVNHLQGAVNAKVHLGLYFNDELVSLMTFGKCRFDKKHEWEMLRFCSKLGFHVVGGAGKLLKQFELMYKPKSIVSYADRRWSNGKLYKALNFSLEHISPPNYWYWKNLKLESRVKYQKHKLKNILSIYNENLSEVENMKLNGYKRIFDCGNLVFEKIY